MEGLIRLINYSLASSFRGFGRWAEVLALHQQRAFWGQDLERELVPIELCPGSLEEQDEEEEKKWSGFLWAAPKKRTSIMKRLRRKFGHENWGSPHLKPKTNLRICDTCGHHYEAFHLCGHCYERIKKETQLIRNEVDLQLGHGPEDKGIVVLYESEKDNADARKVEDLKRKNFLVEVPKPRPNWFSPNLLQRTTLKANPDATSVTATPPKPTISESKDS